ncbi:MAG: class F sortase [Actinomycetota bacterium]|nr:class F sortase [Actinomycetota bacterium]
MRYAAAATAVLLVIGIVSLVLGLRGHPGPPQPAAVEPVAAASSSATAQPTPPSAADAATPSPGASPTATATPTTSPVTPAPDPGPPSKIGPFLPESAPTGIDIPSIGVHSTHFVDLGVAADGTITVPGTADEVGFYTGGPTPGQLGPAVLAAHVDSKQGPGVFYRLGAVKAGSRIAVRRADGSTTTFVVDKVAIYPKDQFPTEQVYRGSFDRSELRLVTCGGTFDKVKHYLDNVVVFAHLETAA